MAEASTAVPPTIEENKDEDVKLTQLITEGKNPRGIPSAKFIVLPLPLPSLM